MTTLRIKVAFASGYSIYDQKHYLYLSYNHDIDFVVLYYTQFIVLVIIWTNSVAIFYKSDIESV